MWCICKTLYVVIGLALLEFLKRLDEKSKLTKKTCRTKPLNLVKYSARIISFDKLRTKVKTNKALGRQIRLIRQY